MMFGMKLYDLKIVDEKGEEIIIKYKIEKLNIKQKEYRKTVIKY